jgi:superkiller protein 3
MKILLAATCLILVTVTATAQDIYNRARSALSAGDTAKAVSAFQEALRAGQKVGDANYYLGIIASAQGRTDEAVGYLTKAAEIDDDSVPVLKSAGDAYLAKGDVQGALPYYRKAARLAPSDPDIAAAYGTALLEADSTDAAIVRISSANVLNPDNALLYVALGDAYMKQNVTALAVTNYQKAIELNPSDVRARMKLASAFEKDRKWTDAVNVYREIQKLDSTKAEAYFLEGNIWFKAKRYKDAVVPLRRYVGLRPTSSEGMAILAQSMTEAKDPEAPVYARKALDLDSTSVDLWRAYFYSLVETKDFAGAEKALKGLQARGALQANDYLRLGDLYFGLGREDEALGWYLKATETDSANCEPYFNMGSLYMRKQDFATAAAMFEKKIACEPRSLSALLNCGICYLTLKDFPASREKLMAAVALKPDYDVSRLWLARYYSQVDSLDQAVEQYDLVLAQVEGKPDKKKVAGEAHYLKGFAYFVRLRFEPALDSFRKGPGKRLRNRQPASHARTGHSADVESDRIGSGKPVKDRGRGEGFSQVHCHEPE